MEYSWSVLSVQTLNSLNELSNVLSHVHYICTMHVEGGEDISIAPVIALDQPTEGFIDYENLSEEIVLSWRSDDFIDSVQQHCIEMLNPQLSMPPVFDDKLPWETEAATV